MTRNDALAVVLACVGVAGVPAHAETVAIVGATVHTATGAPIADGTIVMQGGRIVAVGRDVDIPADARRIDGRGRVATPAFFNSATQLGLTEVSSISATNDAGVSDGSLGAAFDVQYAVNANSLAIRQAESDGLGRAMTLPTSSAGAPFAGSGALLRLGGGPLVEHARLAMVAEVGGQSSARAGGSRSAQWQLIRAALDEARALKPGAKQKAPRDSAFRYDDLVALKAVVDRSLPLVIDADRESDIRQAIALAKDTGIRVILKGGLEAWRAAPELAAAKIPVVLDPTINLPLYFDETGVRADNAALLQQAGVLMAFTTEFSIYSTYNAGFALRQVAGLAVANGVSHEDALAAITRNPAEIWGVADRAGSLAPGHDADVILWDGDPFEPLTNVVAVFLGGREIGGDTRQRALRDRYQPRTPPSPVPPAYRTP